MTKLKKIKLQNYCGYRDFELDFMDGDKIKNLAIFYGPNGTFKSTFLGAVDLLISPNRFTQKKNILTFRRLKYHRDYQAGKEAFWTKVNDLKMEATFEVKGEEKKVILEDNIQGIIFAGLTVDE